MYRSDFLVLYDESLQRIIGIPYFLVHKEETLDFVELKNKIEGQVIEDTVDINMEYEELDEVIVPDVFVENNKLILLNSIDDIHIQSDTLFGRIIVDHISRVLYRKNNILIVQTSSHRFQIIKDDISGSYFLIIYSPRGKYKKILKILGNMFYNAGIVVVPSILDARRIDEIYKDLTGDLLDTTLENFPSSKISKKRIFGKGFQDDVDYLRDSKAGSVYQHRFAYYEKYDDNNIVVSISGDGLLRFFNNISYKYFINFMRKYVLHRLRKLEKGPFLIPLESFILSSLEDDEEIEKIISE